MIFKQHQQTRDDVEHSNDNDAVASDDPVTTESHEIHCAIMNLVLYQISTRQVPLTNMPYNKIINE